MKKILFVVGCCLLLASCTTRFHTGADYKTVTVVYGLLSVNDSAHYIKITKGFYDENTDNRVIALNPDSLYFPNLDVTLQRLENGNPVENFPMQRVDLTLEGYPKLTGVFASQPNYAYKVKQMLNPDKTYRLRIVNNDNGKVIEGETPLVSTATKNFQFVKPFNELESMEFSDENNPYLFRWKGPATATFYDVLIRFRYQEVDMNTNDTTYITKDFPVARNVLYNSGEINTKITNIDFFKQLNSALGAAPDYIKRYVDTPGVMIM
ncbi:MAG TPA: hypothetical protein PLP34_11345, partial [Chitinophagaceae bacterium]|nr:hypothetical protein [Chitinophagaceae bacterium]